MKTMRGAKAVIKRMSILAVLLSGVILAGTSVASAQDCIKRRDRNRTDADKTAESNRDCWARRARSGEKNLGFAFLRRANLSGADLRGANFPGADLSYTDLSNANLDGANFGMSVPGRDPLSPTLLYANLSGASLRRVKGVRLDLQKANLSRADLSDANLRGADFLFANLSNANLREADLSGADLRDADLTGADLSGANLSGAWVSRSSTKGVDFADWEKRGGKVVEKVVD